MLKVLLPRDNRAESRWVCDVVFGEWLQVAVDYSESPDSRISVEFAGKAIRFPESPVLGAAIKRPQDLPLPKRGLPAWGVSSLKIESPLVDHQVPVLIGEPGMIEEGATTQFGLDIFGSIFYMLSRYEEIVLPDRDAHGRFPASASLAFREGFLERPIVDEYVEILWACMKRLWPDLERKRGRGSVFVTCDVDTPYDPTVVTPPKLAKRVAGDLVKRRSAGEALRSVRKATDRWRGDWSRDENNTFGWMMDVCEAADHRAAFFFIADNHSEPHERYELSEPFIQRLLGEIHRRGHEIGMHGAYNSYNNESGLVRQRQHLQKSCIAAGVDQPISGNRQHYLQWDSTQTPALLERAGFEYDTTGSYADVAGFRYGTGRSFPMWDWRNRRGSSVRQRPLIMMESAVFNEAGGDCFEQHEVVLSRMLELKHRALRYGGEFVLLWHNSSLLLESHRWMYRELIRSHA